MDEKHAADKIYASRHEQVRAFEFDERVAAVFPDMINRSVPGYGEIISMLGVIGERFIQPNSHVYDLGCSLGASTLGVVSRLKQPGVKVIGIDNSAAMVERCRRNIEASGATGNIEIRCEDILNVVIENASLVVLNFTLQFIEPDLRLPLLKRIYNDMLPGGGLCLSEKISFENQSEAELNIKLHHDFKRANGYSDLEISQKRTALENVLIPETADAHFARLKEAGFSHVQLWFQCFNFVSLLAIK